MNSRKALTRRQFLMATGSLTVGAALAACTAPAAPAAPAANAPAAEAPAAEPAATEAPAAAEPAATAAPVATVAAAEAPSTFAEAPMLEALVKAGTLPPVAERLPKEPYVVQKGSLVEGNLLETKPGTYGGVLRLAQESTGGDPHIFIGMNEPLLWAPAAFEYGQGISGNILMGYDANPENTVFTFHMREGLKWSDGQPVTTEDVQFAIEDVLMNEELTPIAPAYLRTASRTDGAPPKLEIIDGHTFSLTFDGPYGSFPAQLAIAQWHSYVDLLKPKHYLQQFHIKYANAEDLKKQAESANLPEAEWYNLFNTKQFAGSLWNAMTPGGIGHPVLTPWVLKSAVEGIFTYERNPYYFKVDTEGKQLPYMDGIRSQLVQDKETLTLSALAGNFDYLGERASMKKLGVMKEQEDKGTIKILIPRMHRLPINFNLNLTVDNPIWRQVTNDVRFRQALSLAINRQEIIDTFYFGSYAQLPEKTGTGEYNVDKANELLDAMGLDKKDSEGYRLGSDGKRFEIFFEIGDYSEDHLPMTELIAEYWKTVGVYTTLKKVDMQLIDQHWQANELQGTALWAHQDIWPSIGWDDYLPGNRWGRLWAQWYSTNKKEGEEPPQEIKDLYDTHAKFMQATVGSAESTAALNAIYKSYQDNVWTFNVVEHSYYPTFFSKRVQNVPVGQYEGFGIVVMYSMEQWYLDDAA